MVLDKSWANISAEVEGEAAIEAARPDEELVFTRQQKHDELRRGRQLTEYQKWVPVFLAVFLSVWSIVLFGVVIAVGLGWLDVNVKVLLALVGSTSVNIVGLFGIFVRWVFGKHS